MSNQSSPNQPVIYEIRLKGRLGPRGQAWFEGATISLLDDGDTLLTCPVADQAALHGMLRKVRDLGVPLLSVNRVPPDQGDEPPPNP